MGWREYLLLQQLIKQANHRNRSRKFKYPTLHFASPPKFPIPPPRRRRRAIPGPPLPMDAGDASRLGESLDAVSAAFQSRVMELQELVLARNSKLPLSTTSPLLIPISLSLLPSPKPSDPLTPPASPTRSQCTRRRRYRTSPPSTCRSRPWKRSCRRSAAASRRSAKPSPRPRYRPLSKI